MQESKEVFRAAAAAATAAVSGCLPSKTSEEERESASHVFLESSQRPHGGEFDTDDHEDNDNHDTRLASSSSPPPPSAVVFFEGAEKVLEISFKPQDHSKAGTGLRSVTRSEWQEVLWLVKCQILSVISNDHHDAYLLSESSLFVGDHKLMIKTCGTTRLLHALGRIMEIARSCGFEKVESLYFSRKNFLEPQKQLFPHASFTDEVSVLNSLMGWGTAHILGNVNSDHLVMYTYENMDEDRAAVVEYNLEILMHDLDEKAAKQFYRGPDFKGSRRTTKLTGIQALFPNAILDDLVFDPFGYSINALVDEYYFTIHVTPQPECSFASFETNVPLESYGDLVDQVLAIFKPGRYSISVFADDSAKYGPSNSVFNFKAPEGAVRNEKTRYDFDKFNVTYAHFRRR